MGINIGLPEDGQAFCVHEICCKIFRPAIKQPGNTFSFEKVATCSMFPT